MTYTSLPPEQVIKLQLLAAGTIFRAITAPIMFWKNSR